MDVFSVLWVADTETTDSGVGRKCEPESVSTSAWMEVPEFGIQIHAPILEAYLDDSNCVAKLTIEDSSSSYYADPGVENFKLHLGPTVLIVLTEDVALRLVQVGKFWLSYDLRLHRQTRAALSGCALCADESARDRSCLDSSFLHQSVEYLMRGCPTLIFIQCINQRGSMAKVAKINFAYLLEHDREILLELSW
ncbi:hypothetical protein PsorP6_000221 [Peronosclerospora sorghi]|uniref:Uncharacterized protein n=1 Tax=Peronosclerospora sorghi TaxID=230839 RepID=A0ACC0WW76_9STRA|nr:hypothetical protein PsorP6_000221 [Peronosclerospora sorghi]